MKSNLQSTIAKLLFVFLFFASLFNVSAQVTLPHYEGINYTLPTGGLQTQAGWTVLNTGDDLVISAGSLSYPGLAASVGNKVTFDAGGIDAAKLFTQQTTKVYYSFLLNVTALGSLNSTTGGYFTGFTEGTGNNFGATVWTRADGAGYDIGIAPRTVTGLTQWTSGTTALNTTVLVVVSYEIVAGANNDIVNMWINPTPGAAEPAVTLTATNATPTADLLNLNRILVRQDSASNTPFVNMDELRVGLTWESVTPSGALGVISYTGAPSAITTVYGSISALPTSFNVSGTDISGGILVTAPAGYSVSLSPGSGYGPSVTVPGSGTIASTPVYVSLSTTAAVAGSPYSGNIVLSSSGATPVNVATQPSTVTQKQLTITGIFADNKVFDGNTNATLGGVPVLSGVVNGDSVTLGGTPVATFASSAVGSNIPVSVTGYTISGSGSGNYFLTQPSLSANITSSPPPAITSALIFSATYGTPASTYTITATQSPTSFNATGLPSGLTINTSNGQITGTPTANPGPYNVIISATNAAGTGSETLIYTINPKNLTVTGAVADNKVYTRTDAATISGSVLVGVFGSDVVTISNTGMFASFTVANGITVTSTQTLGGTDAGKYTLTVPTGLSANITPKALTISGATAQNKVFDGNTTATLTGTLSGVISPDAVTLNLSGTFASSAIGTGIAVTSTSTITGTDSGNYSLTQPTGLTASITDTIIYLNQFTGTAACPTQGNVPAMASNATGAPLSRSTITCTTAGNVFNSTTLNNTASSSAISYIEFSATASAGHVLNVSSMSFFRQASASAPNQIEVRYSTDGFASSTLWAAAPITPTSGTIATWDFADFTTPTAGTVTFRVYPYGTQRADLTAPVASAAGTFRLDDVTIYGTVSTASVNPTVNLKLFIEGYYQTGSGLMRPVNMNQGVGAIATNVETITVELHNATAPYALAHTTTAMLKTNGDAAATFTTSPSGSYYIVVKTRNAIETWSATPQTVGGTTSYDFSNDISKAFGLNMINLASGVFGFYSGDIFATQDGNIDTIDYPIWETDSNNFESGIFATDLNGDGNVDTIDYPIWESNSNNFISVVRP